MAAVHPVPPPAVGAAVGNDHWDPCPDHLWPGRVWRTGSHLVRIADQPNPDQQRATIKAEVERSQWLGAEVINSVEVILAVDNWVVSIAPGGRHAQPGHQRQLHAEPDRLPVALGATLRRLHELDPASCPFTPTWGQVVDELDEAVESGRLDPARLRPPYDRYQPERLLELVRLGRPASDDLVVTHGSSGLSNLFVSTTGSESDSEPVSVGVAGLHRLGVADRHRDLAVVHYQLNEAFGPEAVIGFYEGYGLTPDLVALDHYIFIDVLTAALTPIPAHVP